MLVFVDMPLYLVKIITVQSTEAAQRVSMPHHQRQTADPPAAATAPVSSVPIQEGQNFIIL